MGGKRGCHLEAGASGAGTLSCSGPGAAGVVGGGPHTLSGRGSEAGWGGRWGAGGGREGRRGYAGMLAGHMRPQTSPPQLKGCWVLSKAKGMGGATGKWLLLFLSGSFLEKPRLMTQS